DGVIKVVQVGLGGFGRSWAKIAVNAPSIHLVGVADPAADARSWAANELELPATALFSSLDEALERSSCDAVLVITPPETHHALVAQALQAGKHVLVEKPLATTLPEAQELIQTADQAARILMVSQNYRFRAPARAAQQAITGGQLGALIHVAVRCRRDTRRTWPVDNFRYHMRHPYVVDMAIHHVDLLRALTGRNVRRVDARSWRIPDSPFCHDPACAALIELDGGVPVLYEGTWATRDQETSWNAAWEIVGESGRLIWTGGLDDPLSGDVTIETWGQPPIQLPQPSSAYLDRAGTLQAFRVATLTGEEPATSARDNLHSLAVVLGCIASIERGVSVDVATLLGGA
ncbi:MAG: Gfo/Idh/MocA family protein, partial [Thermomicrobiales bacterium]